MKKYVAPGIAIALFNLENVVTTSGQPNTYAANELNIAMYSIGGADGTTTFQIGDLLTAE